MELSPEMLPPVLTREELQLILNEQEGRFQAERERERAEREDEVDALMAAIHDLRRNGDGTPSGQREGRREVTRRINGLEPLNGNVTLRDFHTWRGKSKICSPLSIFQITRQLNRWLPCVFHCKKNDTDCGHGPGGKV